jgi:hypothetical protein
MLENSIARVFSAWGTSANNLWVPNNPTTTP